MKAKEALDSIPETCSLIERSKYGGRVKRVTPDLFLFTQISNFDPERVLGDTYRLQPVRHPR